MCKAKSEQPKRHALDGLFCPLLAVILMFLLEVRQDYALAGAHVLACALHDNTHGMDRTTDNQRATGKRFSPAPSTGVDSPERKWSSSP